MDKKQAIKVTLFSIVALAFVTGAFAAEEETNCITKPAAGVSVASVTEGISFIMAGGIGPLLILVIAFVVGMIVSHVLWGGF
ncbi:MAG: hypothetical protein R6U26_02430 [Candidatus Undinarchaeales archaeon]